jgi:hypothetical protein
MPLGHGAAYGFNQDQDQTLGVVVGRGIVREKGSIGRNVRSMISEFGLHRSAPFTYNN